jgi:uncharacterized protein YoxC
MLHFGEFNVKGGSVSETIAELLKDVPPIALIFAVAAFALAGIIFAIFLRPRIEKFDELVQTLTKLKAEFETLKIPDNLRDLQSLKTEVALLKAAEERRDQKVAHAVQSLEKSLKDLEQRIRQAVHAEIAATCECF